LPRVDAPRTRRTFARLNRVHEVPNLIDIQRRSFAWLTDPENGGLRETISDISPIEDYTGNLAVDFGEFHFDDPVASIEECREKDLTYARPLTVTVAFVNRETGEIREQSVFMGDFPWMTERGTFIINGTERVVVTQLVRSAAAFRRRTNRATLERIVGWMHAKLLNRARPLWEFYVFEGMKDNEIGLYSKMHHACIDGGAGAALTNMIYDVTPVPRQVDPPQAKTSVDQEPRDIAATLLDSYQQFWSEPLRAAAAAKSIELPRSGKSDLGSILFDNAMFQLESAVKFAANIPTMLKSVSDVMARSPIRNRATASPA